MSYNTNISTSLNSAIYSSHTGPKRKREEDIIPEQSSKTRRVNEKVKAILSKNIEEYKKTEEKFTQCFEEIEKNKQDYVEETVDGITIKFGIKNGALLKGSIVQEAQDGSKIYVKENCEITQRRDDIFTTLFCNENGHSRGKAFTTRHPNGAVTECSSYVATAEEKVPMQNLNGSLITYRYAPQGYAKATAVDGETIIFTYENGKRQGLAQETTAEGTITTFTYKNGKRQGLAVKVDKSGVEECFRYKDGMRRGPALKKLYVVTDEAYMEHLTGKDHPEKPNRIAVINHALEEAGLKTRNNSLCSRLATFAEISLCHHADYIKKVETEVGKLKDRQIRNLSTGDVKICQNSFRVARLAVGGVLRAIDQVMTGMALKAFCVVRPPGHHSGCARGAGFCIFNNVAIAARYAQQKYHINRILIVDWDAHPIEEMVHSPLSDGRNTFLTRLQVRLAPKWTCHFVSHTGWGRRNQPAYNEFKIELFHLLSCSWQLKISYEHTPNDDRFSPSLSLVK